MAACAWRSIQAGTFTSDAGTIFGPVPRIMWERLVEAEINPDHTLTQALNCLLVETPAGRVLIETGIGEHMDETRASAPRRKRRRRSCRRCATPASSRTRSTSSRSAISTSTMPAGS